MVYASALDQIANETGRYRACPHSWDGTWTVEDFLMADEYSDGGRILWSTGRATAVAVVDQLNNPTPCPNCGNAPSVAEIGSEMVGIIPTITDWRIGSCTACHAARALTPLVAA